MEKRGRIVAAAFAIVGIACGSAIGYKIAIDDAFRERLASLAKGVVKESKDRMSGMTEEVAVHTAQVTRNPKYTQDWVASQWNAIGF